MVGLSGQPRLPVDARLLYEANDASALVFFISLRRRNGSVGM
jgi:hypothetical protein